MPAMCQVLGIHKMGISRLLCHPLHWWHSHGLYHKQGIGGETAKNDSSAQRCRAICCSWEGTAVGEIVVLGSHHNIWYYQALNTTIHLSSTSYSGLYADHIRWFSMDPFLLSLSSWQFTLQFQLLKRMAGGPNWYYLWSQESLDQS